MKLLAALLILTVITTGCSKADKNGTPAADQPKPSTSSSFAKEAIEGLTGKTTVMQGEQAKAKIKAISAEQNKKLNEVLDDK